MQPIAVNKHRLIKKLISNRKKHVETYEKAKEVHRKKLLVAIERQFAEVTAGKVYKPFIIPTPVSFAEQYDEVISMLEMANHDYVELSQEDHRRYVLDKWEWAANFANNTVAYAKVAVRGKR